MSDAGSDKDEDKRLENELTPPTITKYQTAGDILNRTLVALLPEVVAGRTVGEVCKFGDSKILELCKPVFNKHQMKKGIAFPCCVSVNEIICHLSPLPSDPEYKITLKEGDMAPNQRQQDVLECAYKATEAAIRLIKPGNTNYSVTDAIDKIAKDYECNAVQGMLSHQVLRNVIDGPNEVILNPSDGQKKQVPSFEFEQGQVYGVNMMITTSEGKTKEKSTRTTVFKRNPDATYLLKMKTSRAVFSEIVKECGTMAFSLSSLEDEKKSRMGIVECQTHRLVDPFAVVYEADEKAYVAQFIFTILLMPNGPIKLSNVAFDPSTVSSSFNVTDEDLIKVLDTPVRSKKSKK